MNTEAEARLMAVMLQQTELHQQTVKALGEATKLIGELSQDVSTLREQLLVVSKSVLNLQSRSYEHNLP